MFERPLPKGLPGEALSDVIKSSPPVTIGAVSAAGVSLQDWVYIATLFYLALQVAYLIWKFLKERRSDG